MISYYDEPCRGCGEKATIAVTAYSTTQHKGRTTSNLISRDHWCVPCYSIEHGDPVEREPVGVWVPEAGRIAWRSEPRAVAPSAEKPPPTPSAAT